MKDRDTWTSYMCQSGCNVCGKHWHTKNALALAAIHHDKTGHPTWAELATTVCYGASCEDQRESDSTFDTESWF